jgi:hypothetical protein
MQRFSSAIVYCGESLHEREANCSRPPRFLECVPMVAAGEHLVMSSRLVAIGSDKSSYLVGAVRPLDGGYTAQ